MNELELDQCLRHHPLTAKSFRGVFARDELSRKTLSPGDLYIVNTDLRTSPGKHWVLCCWRDAKPFFFDSFGKAAYYAEIVAFLLPSYDYNKTCLQSETTDVCGHYVAYIATQLCAGLSIQDIRKKFSSNVYLNDRVIVTLFRKEFGYPVVLYQTTSTCMSCKPINLCSNNRPV